MVVPNIICHGGDQSAVHEFSLKSFLKNSICSNVFEMEELLGGGFCKGQMYLNVTLYLESEKGSV